MLPSPHARLASVAALALVAVAGLAGCGPDEQAEPPSVGGNDGPVTEGRYVALGDSYTAGPFLSDEQSDDGCLRSEDTNYPNLVVGELSGLELTDVSCGGAGTENIGSTQDVESGVRPPQLDALTQGTDLVTLGIGGNDYSTFAVLLGSCLALAQSDPDGAPCQEQIDGSDQSLEETGDKIEANIEVVVGDIAERSPEARVLLVGYPDVFPRSGTCDELPLATGDYPLGRQVIDVINDAVEGAAEATGATYVDVFAATEGHDICSDDPWIAGEEPVEPAAPFHPYVEEQQVVADEIVALLQG